MQTYASIGSMSSGTTRGSMALSALLLVGCGVGSAATSLGAAPQRLAIYYGYPSLVNGVTDLDRAVAQFAPYDVVVLGDGLEFDADAIGYAGRAEYAFTRQLIERLGLTPRQTSVFGYVDLGRTQHLPMADVIDRIERWARMGAVGVLLDEAGYDFGVTRERQNAAVDAAHASGLRVCLNAFRPDDVFSTAPTPLNAVGGGNPLGLAPALTERDAILIESFAVGRDVAEPASALAARVQAALDGRRSFGTQVFGIATGERPDANESAAYGWWVAALFGLDAYGWASPDYGAPTSTLLAVPRPFAEERLRKAAYLSAPDVRRVPWRRSTTAGTMTIDPTRTIGSLTLQ